MQLDSSPARRHTHPELRRHHRAPRASDAPDALVLRPRPRRPAVRVRGRRRRVRHPSPPHDGHPGLDPAAPGVGTPHRPRARPDRARRPAIEVADGDVGQDAVGRGARPRHDAGAVAPEPLEPGDRGRDDVDGHALLGTGGEATEETATAPANWTAHGPASPASPHGPSGARCPGRRGRRVSARGDDSSASRRVSPPTGALPATVPSSHDVSGGPSDVVTDLGAGGTAALMDVAPSALEAASPARYADVTVEVGQGNVTLANGLVARTWSLAPFRTDRAHRPPHRAGVERRIHRLPAALDGLEIRSDSAALPATPDVERLAAGGVRLTFDLGIATAWSRRGPTPPASAAGRSCRCPAVLSGYTLDEAVGGVGVAATAHCLPIGRRLAQRRAGRRRSRSAIRTPATGARRPSTRRPVSASPSRAVAVGPSRRRCLACSWSWSAADLPSSAHALRRRHGRGRRRPVARRRRPRARSRRRPTCRTHGRCRPGTGSSCHRSRSSRCSPAWRIDGDDEPWQHWVYLLAPPHAAVALAPSRSTPTTSIANRISTGAKDDVDLAELLQAGRRSPAASVSRPSSSTTAGRPAPATGAPTRRPAPSRAPIGSAPASPTRSFAAVRKPQLGDMSLGLWMSPMHFHTELDRLPHATRSGRAAVGPRHGARLRCNPRTARTRRASARGTRWPSVIDPAGRAGSADRLHRGAHPAGHRPRTASRYFKFDFLVWLDCAGVDARRHVRLPRGVRRHARPPHRRPPDGDVPDRRDQRLPAVPVRVDRPRPELVPERDTGREPAAPQPVVARRRGCRVATLGQHVLSNDTERANAADRRT